MGATGKAAEECRDSDRMTTEKEKEKSGGGGQLRIDGGRKGGSRRCGDHAGSKDAVRPPCCLAVSSAVMKLNEGTVSAESVPETGDHWWP